MSSKMFIPHCSYVKLVTEGRGDSTLCWPSPINTKQFSAAIINPSHTSRTFLTFIWYKVSAFILKTYCIEILLTLHVCAVLKHIFID